MRIEKRHISELNPSAYNPRHELKQGDTQFEKLKNSIKTFGDVEPIVWNERTGNIVGGHQRFNALKSLGETEIYVSVVDLSLEKEKLLNVALNKIKGDWDYDMLSDVLKDFELDELDLSGFSSNEIALFIADDEDMSDFEEVPALDVVEETIHSEDYTSPTNYVVNLVFPNVLKAVEYMKSHGWENHYVKNKFSTIVPILDE